MQAITNEPIAPTLFRLTLPMLFALASMMLLPLVDAYFVGKLGLNELAAISFTMPIGGIVINIALGISMAISSIASRLVGEGNHESVARLISDGYWITLIIAIAIAVVGLQSIDFIFTGMGAKDDVLIFIRQFMLIWFISAPFFMFSIIYSGTFRALGDTKTSALISISATIINMILDPILIFGIGPIPALGIEGAAYATLFSVLISFSLGFFLLKNKEKVLIFSFPKKYHFLPNFIQLAKIGINTIFANLMTPVAATILTIIIAEQGTAAVAGFGVGSRIEMLTLIIIFALSSTLPMFVGQNMGAGKKVRVHTAITNSLKFSIIVQLVIYCIIAVSAPSIANAFSNDPEVISITVLFLRILPLTYGFHGVVILVMVCLNVLHKPGVALITTLVRMFILYIPFAWIGVKLNGMSGLFTGAAIANIIAAIFAYLTIRYIFKQQEIKPETK